MDLFLTYNSNYSDQWFVKSDLSISFESLSPPSKKKQTNKQTNYIYLCISRPFMTEKSVQKITLNLYMGHRQIPDPNNPKNLHYNCLKSVSKTEFTKPVLIVFEFHQFSACSSSMKKFEIINFMWLKQKPTGADFYYIFWSVQQTFFLTALLQLTVLWTLIFIERLQ